MRPLADSPPSEITPRPLFEDRRAFLRTLAGLGLAGSLPGTAAESAPRRGIALATSLRSPYSTGEKLTAYDEVTGYNNFQEFGINKLDPARNAHRLPTRPWTVTLEGLVRRPRTLDLDDILRLAPLEERIYRLRCVEGWSMVVPWIGFPLDALLRQVEPLGSARYVEFESYYDQARMSLPFFVVLEFPYVEGLRLDEARHPLTLLTLGLYGEVLPPQNGAPLRVVVPWKAMCSRRCEMPCSSGFSSRPPTPAHTPSAAVSRCGMVSVTTVRPDASLVRLTLILPLPV